MTFAERLEDYIARLRCSARELSDASGLSAVVISRYRSGERRPAHDGEHVGKLAAGIAAVAAKRGMADMTVEGVLDDLRSHLEGQDESSEKVIENLNTLVSIFSINLTELAHFLNFDPSYLSRIRASQRRPANVGAFVTGVSRFVVRRYGGEVDRVAVADLIGVPRETLEDDSAYLETLQSWLRSGNAVLPSDVGVSFMHRLDEFDLDEYARSIRFDEMKMPALVPPLPATRTYEGIDGIRAAELDFLKATALSRSDAHVVMYCNMPVGDLAADHDFTKEWISGLAVVLKKGLHLDVIHDLERPFNEMMIGLESYIPLYMTGQISPFYLTGQRDAIFKVTLRVSGDVALEGECIAGHHDRGRCRLTKKRAEVDYMRHRADDLLAKALPLMEIYRSDQANVYRTFLEIDAQIPGPRHRILASPPLHTITDGNLVRILERNGVPASEVETICAYVRRYRAMMERIMDKDRVCDEIPRLSESEFLRYPMVLSLSGMFHEGDIRYTYEEYRAHLESTEVYARNHARYELRATDRLPFRNIQIAMHEGKWAMVSKNRAPVIHFVIRHPKLRDAIENMVIPVAEGADQGSAGIV